MTTGAGDRGGAPTEPALMRGLLEGVPDPAAVLDAQLNYVAFNQAYASTVAQAFSAGAALGSSVDPLLASQKTAEGASLLDALSWSLKGSSTFQQLGRFRSHCHPLRDASGEVCGVLHLLQGEHVPAGTETERRSLLRLGSAFHLAALPSHAAERPRIRVFAWDAAIGDLAWSGSLQDFIALVSRLPPPTALPERMNPEDSRRLAERISAWQREGRTETSFDFRLVQPDGTQRALDAWARLIPASDSAPARLVGVNVDVTDAVRAEQELVESRAAYERLMDVTADGILLLVLYPDGATRIARANPAFRHLSGRDAASLQGVPLERLVAEEDRAELQRQVRALSATGQLQHEFRIDTTTGQQVTLQATSSAFEEGGQRMALCMVRDITPRALREQDLPAEEQALRTLTEALPGIVWTANASGQVDFYNARWFTYTGLPTTLGFGEGWAEVIHPDDRARLVTAWHAAVAQRGRYEQEGRVRQKDGRYHWFLHRAYPVTAPDPSRDRWIGTSTDINPIKASEVALRERERWLGGIVETIPHMVWTASPGGALEYQSRQLVQYTGGATRTSSGLPWAFHPEDEKRAAELWRRLTKGERGTSGEFRLRRHDGAYLWFSVAAAPLLDADGHLLRWIGTWTDITALKSAVEQLHEADRRKDEFLAVLSHELRNPLAPIRLSLVTLEQAAPGSPPWQRAMSILHRQSQQLSRLVDDLLDLTRMSRGKIRLQLGPMDLTALVAKCAEDHRGEFEQRGVRLTVSLPPRPAWVHADGIRLAQAVGNLLQNAAKFTPPGGSASVRLQPRGPSVQVVVEDTGQGISSQMLPRLFEPFAQAESGIERSKGGLGLGLALVKTLAQMHGGSVAASSPGLGRGACFALTLPTIPEPAAIGSQGDAAIPVERRRVLVIEDNKDAAESLQAVLESSGHVVTVAYDGTGGVVSARAAPPDVVLCDIGLPGMDGFAVARALRSSPELTGTRLYALTGYASADDVRRAKEAGFAALIPKPASESQLADAVAGRI